MMVACPKGRTERYFAAPKVRGQESPGFHVTELQVFRYLANLPNEDPRHVAAIGKWVCCLYFLYSHALNGRA